MVKEVRGARQSAKIYMRSLLAVLLLALVPFTFNVVIDPLWYFGGNQLGPNYPFNERISKANRFLDHQEDFDCVILGSSRTTLLDEQDIAGLHCFNFAVSQARFSDELQIARFVGARGLQPKVVIVALDGFNFSEPLADFRNPMPPFISNGQNPPNVVATYLSADSFVFSWKTFRQQPPNDRYYDSSFAAHALPGAGPYVPERPLGRPQLVDREGGFNQFTFGPFQSAPGLAQFREVFPRAELIAYVPPVTADWVAKLSLAGTLESYLSVLLEAREHFDEVLDFSVPSPITTNPDNTYDGSHFYQDVNAYVGTQIAAARKDRRAGGASRTPETDREKVLALHALDEQQYRSLFRLAVEKYLDSIAVADGALSD